MRIERRHWLIALVMAALTAAILLWNTGVSLVGVPVASLYSNTAPIFAIGIGAAMGREPAAWTAVSAWLSIGLAGRRR